MTVLYCDLETYSTVPVDCGAHRYAEEAEVLLFAYAFDDEPVHVWDAVNGEVHADGEIQTVEWDVPKRLRDALEDPNVLTVWHNGGNFDRVVLKHALGIDIPIQRVHDTMVQALTHGLPGSLDMLGEIFKLAPDKAKLKTGKSLINLFCKPLGRNRKLDRATKETHPEEWQAFVDYASQDIEAMRVLKQRMPMWNYQGAELELWHLDQTINDRGFYVDLDLAEKAVSAVTRCQAGLAKQIEKVTGGEVKKATQRDVFLEYLQTHHGVLMPDLTKATVERYLSDESISAEVKNLLTIRKQASASSTSKYKKLVSATSADRRLRGTLQFCGASRTGRWAGRVFQPQNLPRPTMRADDIEVAVDHIKSDIIDLTHADVMEATSSSVRGCICAAPGEKLCVSDLSNIEGRAAAWLAGEDWKVQAFSDFDKGEGHDLYALAYAKSFNITPEEVMENKKTGDGSMRQIGKVMELALQYEGGVGAFTTFADGYGIDLQEMANVAYDKIPTEVKSAANSFWGYANINNRTLGLDEKTFVVCDSLKRMWRDAHPAISSYWGELQTCVTYAIRKPETEMHCRRLRIVKNGAWLRIILPSGRSLCYAGARVEDDKISYMGVNQYTRKWGRIDTYGGKLFENITQAVARDIMAGNMRPIDGAGYKIILSVHDELLTETPDKPFYSHERLSELLATVPDWGEGMPLAAGGFEAYRYRKD